MGDCFGLPRVFTGGLLGLGLGHRGNGVKGDFPIRSILKTKGGGPYGVKEEVRVKTVSHLTHSLE